MPNKIVESGGESALRLYDYALVSLRLYEHLFLLLCIVFSSPLSVTLSVVL